MTDLTDQSDLCLRRPAAEAQEVRKPTPMSEPERLRVVVAVLTFKRPRLLGDLLDDLAREVTAATTALDAVGSCRIVIVDNDPDRSAAPVVATAAGNVNYLCEPRPGLSAARNRALDEARHDDVLVFIDDDERPRPGWLGLMLRTYLDSTASAVAGAVESRFEVEPEPWIVRGRFFQRRRPPTGTRIQTAATNNLLLDVRRVRATGLRFDDRFALSGGEDTLFTRSLHRLGEPMVWCDEAVVVDLVPAARSTRRWVLMRAFSSGNSDSVVRIELGRSRWHRGTTRLHCVADGSARLLLGSVMAAAGLARPSSAWNPRGLRMVQRGRGMCAGAFGRAYQEYGRA